MQQSFMEWLAHTPLSLAIHGHWWVIPSLQSVHILAIAATMTAVLLVHLRIVGLFNRNELCRVVVKRFAPWVYKPLPVLALSGALLIVAEPERALTSVTFLVKMLLLLAGLVLMVMLQRHFSRPVAHQIAGSVWRACIAVGTIVSLLVWVGVIFAGRLVAYF
jgi:hypothetical protein